MIEYRICVKLVMNLGMRFRFREDDSGHFIERHFISNEPLLVKSNKRSVLTRTMCPGNS